MRVLDGYEPYSYYENINDGNVDILSQLDMLNGDYVTLYTVGDMYGAGMIVDIYYHDTSDCAWMVVRTEDGGYFEIDIEGTRQYCEEAPFN